MKVEHIILGVSNVLVNTSEIEARSFVRASWGHMVQPQRQEIEQYSIPKSRYGFKTLDSYREYYDANLVGLDIEDKIAKIAQISPKPIGMVESEIIQKVYVDIKQNYISNNVDNSHNHVFPHVREVRNIISKLKRETGAKITICSYDQRNTVAAVIRELDIERNIDKVYSMLGTAYLGKPKHWMYSYSIMEQEIPAVNTVIIESSEMVPYARLNGVSEVIEVTDVSDFVAACEAFLARKEKNELV